MTTDGHGDHGALTPGPPSDPQFDQPALPVGPGRRRAPAALRALMMVPLLLVSLSAALLGAFFIYYSIIFPDPFSLKQRGNGPSIRIMAADGSLIAERGASRAYIPVDFLPKHVTEAVIATEDRRFYDHPGLDPVGLVRALLTNLRSGHVAQGGSTLTQQLAKNLFLSSERTFSRKFEEIILALWLELKLSKQEILELYLNRVYLGAGAYGIETAAQRYFGKSARDLSLGEGAVIAGLLKAPSKYSPSANPETALSRGRVVLGLMREAGYITAAEEAEARSLDVRFETGAHSPEKAELAYAIDYVLDRAQRYTTLDQAEVAIWTTLDAALQRRASETVIKALSENGARLNATQAAVVVLGKDGGIRALVGGRSYAESQFNRAVQARRQPGSTFKPFVYLTALEHGYTPDTLVEDAPIQLGTWSPKNDDGRYLGPTTLRTALARSINTVAVRLVRDVGAEAVAGTAERLGMKSVLRTDASLALGTSEVSLLDITGAYGVFGNGGFVNEPYAISRVTASGGRVLFQRLAASSEPTLKPDRVGAMNDMLRETLISGTGKRAALAGHPAAGKTGTSQDFRDAWFIGYTAHFTAGVWLGNDDGQPMHKVLGGTLPAEIWREIMTAAHQGLPPVALPDGRAPAGGAAAATDAAVAAAAPPPRIEEDFIQRLLTAPGEGSEAAETQDVAQAQGETSVDPVSGRIIVRPPPVP